MEELSFSTNEKSFSSLGSDSLLFPVEALHDGKEGRVSFFQHARGRRLYPSSLFRRNPQLPFFFFFLSHDHLDLVGDMD